MISNRVNSIIDYRYRKFFRKKITVAKNYPFLAITGIDFFREYVKIII